MSSGSTTNDALKERALKDPRALLQHVEELRRTGRHKDAIAACLEGLQHLPNLDAVRITLGRAYLESGQTETARDVLKEIFARLPEHHLAGKLLAEAQIQLGEHLAAASTCRDLLSHYPRDRDIEALLKSATEPPPVAPPGASTSAAPAAAPARPAPPVPAAPIAAAPASAAAAPSPATLASDPSLEYRPEDLAAAAPAAPPVAQPSAGRGRDFLQTNTLAELYVRQGLTGKALEVYRGMLRVDPGNEALKRRVQELERPASSPPVSKTAPPRPETAAITPPPAPLREEPPRNEAPPQRRTVARLESWLAAIQAGSGADPTRMNR
jgi:tetratricopeptide (TPR) repeat protein